MREIGKASSFLWCVFADGLRVYIHLNAAAYFSASCVKFYIY